MTPRRQSPSSRPLGKDVVNWFLSVFILTTSLLLVGCSSPPIDTPEEPIEGARITGATLNQESAGSESLFVIDVDTPGTPIGLDLRGTLLQGSLRLQLVNAEDVTPWDIEIDTTGPFAINTVIKPDKAGAYQLELTWSDATQATYNVRWQPGEIETPEISALALIPGIGMIVVALGYILYTAIHSLGWSYLGLGAGSWIVTVVIKFIWALSANNTVYETLTEALPETSAQILFYIYVGLLTGVFEVALLWLAIRNTKFGKVSWQRALSFGIGFGAMEALVLGGSALANAIVGMTSPTSLPLAALEQIAQTNNLLYGLAPVSERLFTVLIHTLSNVLLFYSIATDEPRAFWLGFAYKSGIDVIAAFAQFWGIDTIGRIWLIEAIVILWGIAGWLGIRQMKERYPSSEAVDGQDQ